MTSNAATALDKRGNTSSSSRRKSSNTGAVGKLRPQAHIIAMTAPLSHGQQSTHTPAHSAPGTPSVDRKGKGKMHAADGSGPSSSSKQQQQHGSPAPASPQYVPGIESWRDKSLRRPKSPRLEHGPKKVQFYEKGTYSEATEQRMRVDHMASQGKRAAEKLGKADANAAHLHEQLLDSKRPVDSAAYKVQKHIPLTKPHQYEREQKKAAKYQGKLETTTKWMEEAGSRNMIDASHKADVHGSINDALVRQAARGYDRQTSSRGSRQRI